MSKRLKRLARQVKERERESVKYVNDIVRPMVAKEGKEYGGKNCFSRVNKYKAREDGAGRTDS